MKKDLCCDVRAASAIWRILLGETIVLDDCPGRNTTWCTHSAATCRSHCVLHGNEWWKVLCFADKAPDTFRLRFAGVHFDPKDRRGSNWARWKR